MLERYVKDFAWCSHLRLGFKRILRRESDLSNHSAALHRKNKFLSFYKWPLMELYTEKM